MEQKPWGVWANLCAHWTNGVILPYQIPCRAAQSHLQCLDNLQICLTFHPFLHRQSLNLSAIFLLGRDEGTCKILSEELMTLSSHLHSWDHLYFIEQFPDLGAVGKFLLFIFFLQIYFLAHTHMYCVTVVYFILRLLLQ